MGDVADDAYDAAMWEDEDGAGPYTCSRCLAGTWNDDDVCDECNEEAIATLSPKNTESE